MKWRWFLGVVGIFSVLGFSFWNLSQSGFLNLSSVDVVVENFTEQKFYLKPLIGEAQQSVSGYIGQSLWKLNPKEIAKNIEALPWVDSVRVSLHWPASLRVEIKAKPISVLLARKNGSFQPVTQDGDLLPAVKAAQTPDVAVLKGEVFETQREKRQQAVQLLNSVPEKGSFSQESISEIHFDDQDGFWIHLMYSGLRVNLGQDQVLAKSMRVSQVLNYLDQHQLDARVIDANLSKKVLVRLRKGP